MNTPAHLIFGLAAFARPHRRYSATAAVLGSIAPDLSLYLMAGTALFVLGISPQVVFDELYFSQAWQTVFAIDNSFILWSALLAAGMWSGRRLVTIFAGSGLLHIAFDFALHHDDGRAHFWPISRWIFESPVSYWDSRHYGNIVGAIEVLACVALAVLIFRRFTSLRIRLATMLFLGLEFLSGGVFALIF